MEEYHSPYNDCSDPKCRGCEDPEWLTETCEHGLSAWLCSGPMHYSDEF